MKWLIKKDGETYTIMHKIKGNHKPRGEYLLVAGPDLPRDEVIFENGVVVENKTETDRKKAYEEMDAAIIADGIAAFGTKRIDSMTFSALGWLCRALKPQMYIDAGFKGKNGNLDTPAKMSAFYFQKLVTLDIKRMTEISKYLGRK